MNSNQLKYHYTIINKKTGEVLAESDYHDYMKILQIELINLHEGFIDTKDIVIVDKLIRKEEKKDNLSKHLIVLIERYLGAVSYDIDQSDYGYAIVKDIKQTIKEFEEELK